MSTAYVCTQCGQAFRVGEGAGVALDCLSCGGLSLPQVAEGSSVDYAEEVDPGLRVRPQREASAGSWGDGDADEGDDLHKLPTAILDQATEVLRVPEEALPLAGLPHAPGGSEDSYLYSWPGDEESPESGEGDEDVGARVSPLAPGVSYLRGREEPEDESPDLDEDASTDEDASDEDAYAGQLEHAPSSPSLPASLFQHLHEATPEPRRVPSAPLGQGLPLRERSSPGLHLVLSDEARALAGVSREDTEPEAVPPPARRVVPLGAATPRAAPSPGAPPGPSLAVARAPSPDSNESTRESSTTLRIARAPPLVRSARPRALGAVALGSALAGLLWGLVTGGPEVPRSATARGRAEERLSEGNRAFAESRYDDALAHYRESWVQDRAYAPALRARAVTLARLRRHEEAAAAYRQYLESEPSAADAPEVREVLTRFAGRGASRP